MSGQILKLKTQKIEFFLKGHNRNICLRPVFGGENNQIRLCVQCNILPIFSPLSKWRWRWDVNKIRRFINSQHTMALWSRFLQNVKIRPKIDFLQIIAQMKLQSSVHIMKIKHFETSYIHIYRILLWAKWWILEYENFYSF